MKACPASDGAFDSKCDATRLLRATEDEKASATPSFFWNSVYHLDFTEARRELESEFSKNGKKLVAQVQVKIQEKEKKAAFKRLLAAHMSDGKGDDSCAEGKGNYYCDDATMYAHTKYSSVTCERGTDTKDCKGIYKDTACEAGKCCCSCSVSLKYGDEGKDVWSYPALLSDGTTPFDEDDASTATSDTCESSTCKTHCKTLTLPSISFIYPVTRYIRSDWNKAEVPTTCAEGAAADSSLVCEDDEVLATGADANCAKKVCVAADFSYYTGSCCEVASSNPGCLKCCGVDKTEACAGTSPLQTTDTDSLFEQVQQIAMYAAFSGVVGVTPAIIGGFAKFKSMDGVSNIFGTISVFSTLICGVCGTGGLAAFLMILGGYVGVYCVEVKNQLEGYEDLYAEACTDDCKAALDHQIKAFCDVGTALGSVSMVTFIVVGFAVGTLIMTCIGFCTKSQQVAPVQNQQQQMQMVTPGQQQAVVMAQPQQQPVVMAVATVKA